MTGHNEKTTFPEDLTGIELLCNAYSLFSTSDLLAQRFQLVVVSLTKTLLSYICAPDKG